MRLVLVLALGLGLAGCAGRPRNRQRQHRYQSQSVTPSSGTSPTTRTSPPGRPRWIPSRCGRVSGATWTRSTSRKGRWSRRATCFSRSTRGPTRPSSSGPRGPWPNLRPVLHRLERDYQRVKILITRGAVGQEEYDRDESDTARRRPVSMSPRPTVTWPRSTWSTRRSQPRSAGASADTSSRWAT